MTEPDYPSHRGRKRSDFSTGEKVGPWSWNESARPVRRPDGVAPWGRSRPADEVLVRGMVV
ncbi:hypothetical protein [Nocardiopsis ansamitocini]|uniref:hypothetical protein n=1 Tax=Nocardiopsis ansamitocini TaxID=1670832 RepID=UPI00255526B8|nr:hypothetical protein [Nocardiopsis ansamitocini]